MLRSEQPFFFAVPKRKQQRAPRRMRQRADRFDDFQQAGDAAGIVIGSVVDLTDRTAAVT